MKKLSLILVLFFSVFSSCKTNENTNYNTVINQITEHYNANNYQAIYNLYTPKKQQISTKQKTTDFYKNKVKAVSGKCKSTEFITTLNGKQVYKLYFEKSEALLTLKLDSNNKIEYLLLKS